MSVLSVLPPRIVGNTAEGMNIPLDDAALKSQQWCRSAGQGREWHSGPLEPIIWPAKTPHDWFEPKCAFLKKHFT